MTYSSESDGASSLDGGRPCFTSYDFWCSGIDPEVLQPVKEAPGLWSALVDEPGSSKKFYPNPPDSDLLRSQLPCAMSHQGHYNSWSEDFWTV